MRLIFTTLLLTIFFDSYTQDVFSTKLPIVVISTSGAVIGDEPKTSATLKIIYDSTKLNSLSDNANVYDGPIGIEIRGRYSASFPQKSYGFETRDSFGADKNFPLLNMPEEHDWILLANYNDKSFARNSLSFDLFREMGHYAPRARLCEVFLNNSYEGIYLFTEKIKRDKNRVDIGELDLDDNAGDSISGGYIFGIDYFDTGNSWQSSSLLPGYPSKTVNFVYNYPAANEITFQQKAYIKNYIAAFEKTLYGNDFLNGATGYRSFINVNSFVDYFIVNEVARNVDGYKKSCFYTKAKKSKGGLIEAGPVWDFDWAWKDIWDCSIFKQTDGSGWAYKILNCDPWPTPTGWMPRMMQDPLFVEQLKNRYTMLRRTFLSNVRMVAYLDSIKSNVTEAQGRHYNRWNILGETVGAPEVGYPASTYDEEIDNLKNWIFRRLAWLDGELLLTSVRRLDNDADIKMFPNPACDFITIESQIPIKEITIVNLAGQEILRKYCQKEFETINISELPKGFYILKVLPENGINISRKLTIE